MPRAAPPSPSFRSPFDRQRSAFQPPHRDHISSRPPIGFSSFPHHRTPLNPGKSKARQEIFLDNNRPRSLRPSLDSRRCCKSPGHVNTRRQSVRVSDRDEGRGSWPRLLANRPKVYYQSFTCRPFTPPLKPCFLTLVRRREEGAVWGTNGVHPHAGTGLGTRRKKFDDSGVSIHRQRETCDRWDDQCCMLIFLYPSTQK